MEAKNLAVSLEAMARFDIRRRVLAGLGFVGRVSLGMALGTLLFFALFSLPVIPIIIVAVVVTVLLVLLFKYIGW